MEAFSQDLVSRITGLSRSQLEYWDRTDVIKPSIAEYEGRGSPRLYSFRDLVALKVAAAMRHKLLPSQMRQLMEQLEERGFKDPFVTVTFAQTMDGHQLVFIDPQAGPLSAHGREVGTLVATFGLEPRNLMADLETGIAKAMTRKHGRIRKTRGVHGGDAVVEGTRVPASKIAALAAAGWDQKRILEAYPHLSAEDIDAALRYQHRLGARTA